MNFKPQDFFIGLIDFFSIIMPGALLVYMVKHWAPENRMYEWLFLDEAVKRTTNQKHSESTDLLNQASVLIREMKNKT